MGGDLLRRTWRYWTPSLTNRPNPQAPGTRGEGEVGGAVEPDGAPLFEKAVRWQTPPAEAGLGQSENENTNFSRTISTFLQLSQGLLDCQSKAIPHGSHIKPIDGLSEDPEDHPVGFVPIIERHNARLEKAHLLHEATRPTIEQKWSEGVTLGDIGKLLYSWAPEPYRNKPMPRAMIQALLLIAPNSQT